MHVTALFLAAGSVLAQPFVIGTTQQSMQRPHRETQAEAVKSAAHLAKTVGTGTLASVFPAGGDNADYPLALMESHAPCHPDGALTFISMPISLMQRNIKAAGGKASYALSTPREDGRHNEYAIPRVSFIGDLEVLENVDQKEHKRLRDCFVSYHPEAKWWIPDESHSAHVSHWAKFNVQDIYYVGGFGNVGWIGHISPDDFAKEMDK